MIGELDTFYKFVGVLQEGSVRQAKFCLRVCQEIFSLGFPVFALPTDSSVTYMS